MLKLFGNLNKLKETALKRRGFRTALLKEGECMDCKSADSFFTKYMDGVLTEKEAEEMNCHIKICSKCESDFLIYDAMVKSFVDAQEEVANIAVPEGFEARVMEKIRELPQDSAVQIKEKKDNFSYTLWIAITAILGLGFIITINSTEILNYLESTNSDSIILQIFKPVSISIVGFAKNIYVALQNLFAQTATLMTDFRIVIVAVFLLGAAVYYGVSKSRAKSKANR